MRKKKTFNLFNLESVPIPTHEQNIISNQIIIYLVGGRLFFLFPILFSSSSSSSSWVILEQWEAWKSRALPTLISISRVKGWLEDISKQNKIEFTRDFHYQSCSLLWRSNFSVCKMSVAQDWRPKIGPQNLQKTPSTVAACAYNANCGDRAGLIPGLHW